jgi:hypothetical protein
MLSASAAVLFQAPQLNRWLMGDLRIGIMLGKGARRASPPQLNSRTSATPATPAPGIPPRGWRQGRLDLAIRIPDGHSHLRERLHHLGLALHDENAGGYKAKVLGHSCEGFHWVWRVIDRQRCPPGVTDLFDPAAQPPLAADAISRPASLAINPSSSAS